MHIRAKLDLGNLWISSIISHILSVVFFGFGCGGVCVVGGLCGGRVGWWGVVVFWGFEVVNFVEVKNGIHR